MFVAVFIWLVNDQLFSLECVSTQHLGYSDNMVIGRIIIISRTLSAVLFFEGPHLEVDNIAFRTSSHGMARLKEWQKKDYPK
jgi:hypothetical protein